ncbi:diphosphate--fructose-6-phosphate 1-phosphotransferase [Paenactinomyces guangxiensis]|uniref:Diphosphate--fructose-6-phosphate 1-phosphotransferase n=1 Tax=Paenactinomyces guangxiensis TaxID=1490290 RepID=A0A7W1WP37_9BACL|nr:diphosphate--fructose-6-phosphate 1-phosphotransferase [Paenactinomyces guangxiensis]MBA4493450.1 diphosphate--fructose-6-phosphate 1-phosphotransferase [Paenactinomyces guangxiensis]MBH8590541.1 diphosphate--fructose-6-phosphate 1-phosphotransferase [Paenactinomyces guangxiensis]
MKKILIGQAGGPTAVFNSSLVGFIEKLPADIELYVVWNGYKGLAEGNISRFPLVMKKEITSYHLVPGAMLGAGRYPFTEEKMEQAIEHLRSLQIHSLVFAGGNGTMAALQKLSEVASAMSYDLQVIGIPKTVDNDLSETDHAPGFGSAARYVALAAQAISKDLEAMKNFEQVRIIETMGRNAGWLAAASGYLKKSPSEGPHAIYLPEVPILKKEFLQTIRDCVKEFGFATVVASEGVRLIGERQTEQARLQGRVVLGGISNRLAELVRDELGLAVRGENLGMIQRAAFFAVSDQDVKEAIAVGQEAANLVMSDQSHLMVSLQRASQTEYTFILEHRSLGRVMRAGERLLPKEMIANREKYYEWLSPLVGTGLVEFPEELERRIQDEENPCGVQ